MALTTQTVTGNIYYPDGTPMEGSILSFTLSGPAASPEDSGTVPPTFVNVTCDSLGAFTVELWPNGLGTTSTTYIVNVTYTEEATGKEVVKRLGTIQPLVSGGPYTLAELLAASSVAPDAVYLGIITEAQYNSIIDAADRAEDAESAAVAAAVAAGNPPASFYGILSTNTPAQNATAFNSVPSGVNVDMGGIVVSVDEVPVHFNAYNGSWLKGGKIVPLLREPVNHPLDGQWMAGEQGVGGGYHTGPVWYQQSSNRVWRVISKSESHDVTDGMRVVVEYSEDSGQSWTQSSSLYADNDRGISGMSGGLMGNGRFGVFISSWNRSDETRQILFFYSDDNGSTWEGGSAITGISGPNAFLFDQLHKFPASVGGDDEEGFFFITYRDNGVFLNLTDDNGATWTSRTVVVRTGAREISIARVGNEDKWVGLLRWGSANFDSFTTTDLLNFTFVDSGIPDTGTGAVGSPPHLIYDGGKLFLYLPYRELWSPDNSKEGYLLYYEGNASQVFDNDGKFLDLSETVASSWPSRALGMIFSTRIGTGFYAHARAGETVYPTANYEPITNTLISVTNIPRVSAGTSFVKNIPNENLFRNSDFCDWETPEASSYSVRAFPCKCWGLITSGITFNTVERVTLDPVLSRNFPHRPIYGMRLQATTGNDNAGFDQRFHGPESVYRFADQIITITVYGTGTLPDDDLFRARIDLIYDGSSPLTSSSTFNGLKSYEGGGWSASATVFTPTAEGMTIGANASVRLYFDCGASTEPWDVTFCGVKAEFGQKSTPMTPVDRAKDLALVNAHTEIFGRDGEVICDVNAYSTNLALGKLAFTPKVTKPTVTVVGDETVIDVLGKASATGVTFDRVTTKSAQMRLTTSVTSETGPVISPVETTYVKVTTDF